ncbi:MAG: C4-type zinc ribbon domain-containing protein [Bacteroidia bacterium]|nr:C4-type zinc ribbon domain-containing protein [Bacteroidia bacterium]MDW8301841.1 C4-type zinc ribbon domain-containing protein [Bacteroidia bacterium]
METTTNPIEQKLINLAYLQAIDTKIYEIQKIRGDLPNEVKDLEDELIGLENRFRKIEENLHTLQSEVKNYEITIKECKAKIEKYTKQQNNVKNNREFEALSKEIDLQKLEIEVCEKHIKDRKEPIEESKKQLEETKKLIAAKKAELNTKKSELTQILESTRKEEEYYLELRKKAEAKIEARLLNGYKRIRDNVRNGLVVVPIQRESCGGCFNAVPPQRRTEVRLMKQIIFCENCGRILVDESLIQSIVVQ